MTKSELIERLAKHYPQLVVQDAQVLVRTILDALAESLTRGQRVEIRGFGNFGLNYRPPRSGRNPKSGQKVQVPAKYVPHFKVARNYAIGTRSINYFLAREFLRDLRHNFGKEIKKKGGMTKFAVASTRLAVENRRGASMFVTRPVRLSGMTGITRNLS